MFGLWSKKAGVRILPLPLAGCMALGKALNQPFCESQFPHMTHGMIRIASSDC